ncbi:hypothetical protein HGRIS_006054 [Hohenbuehelia grisea]|uniref:Transcription factor CBF/NF-Y/archaeal histone domain-containing protein n=1 Tax=Hohenbuehelia grisea TaxID=104357 RepID=A0ABR3JYM8_9AGAR
MFHPLSDPNYPNDSEAEDGVDQLYSDSEDEPEGPSANAQKPASSSAKGRVRSPGQTLLPAQRVENMLQADGITGNLTLSKEGLYVLSVATEEFIKRMVQAGERHASAERRNLVTYRDMGTFSCDKTPRVYISTRYLLPPPPSYENSCRRSKDTIPTPIPIAEAFRLRSQKEREHFELDPATAGSSSVATLAVLSAPPPLPLPPVQSQSKSEASNPKSKTRLTNGKSNGSTNHRGGNVYPNITPDPIVHSENRSESISRTGSADLVQAANGRDARTRSRQERASYPRSQSGTLSISEHDVAPGSSLSITPTPVPSRDEPIDTPSPGAHPSAPYARDNPRPAQLTGPGQPSQLAGPASAFLLQGPGAPFGRGSQNPGRTIYSQRLPLE